MRNRSLSSVEGELGMVLKGVGMSVVELRPDSRRLGVLEALGLMNRGGGCRAHQDCGRHEQQGKTLRYQRMLLKRTLIRFYHGHRQIGGRLTLADAASIVTHMKRHSCCLSVCDIDVRRAGIDERAHSLGASLSPS